MNSRCLVARQGRPEGSRRTFRGPLSCRFLRFTRKAEAEGCVAFGLSVSLLMAGSAFTAGRKMKNEFHATEIRRGCEYLTVATILQRDTKKRLLDTLQTAQQFGLLGREFFVGHIPLVTKSAESFQCFNDAITLWR